MPDGLIAIAASVGIMYTIQYNTAPTQYSTIQVLHGDSYSSISMPYAYNTAQTRRYSTRGPSRKCAYYRGCLTRAVPVGLLFRVPMLSQPVVISVSLNTLMATQRAIGYLSGSGYFTSSSRKTLEHLEEASRQIIPRGFQQEIHAWASRVPAITLQWTSHGAHASLVIISYLQQRGSSCCDTLYVAD